MHKSFPGKFVLTGLLALASFSSAAWAQVPPITGAAKIIGPKDLLDWPAEFPPESPNLTEQTANRLNDFHGELSDCDIVLSTAGNFHMALAELWQVYLYEFAADLNLRNWFYTTSPPVAPDQISNQVVQFGNLAARCVPQVAVGPGAVINAMIARGQADGAAVPIIKNYGNVILVRKGNPKRIRSVWDLGREGVTVITPNPSEGGSYANFIGSIYNIAANDPHPPTGMTATDLFNSIFNAPPSDDDDDAKWVAGGRIMHREIPWAIAAKKADAGVIFYHLALHAVRTFPNKFDIVPLGGTVEAPQPLPGNQLATLLAVRVKGNWSAKQLEARERLMQALSSSQFTRILTDHGLRRP